MSTIITNAGSVEPVFAAPIPHMPGCHCGEYESGEFYFPTAFMANERAWTRPGKRGTDLAYTVLRLFREAAEAAGVPILSDWERRTNDVGLPYGEPRVRSCELIEYKLLLASVSAQLDETVQRMVSAREGSR